MTTHLNGTDPFTATRRDVRHSAYGELLPPGYDAAKNTHLLNLDPPNHTRLRKLVSAAFTRRHVDALGPRIQALTDELLDALTDAPGQVDLIDCRNAAGPGTGTLAAEPRRDSHGLGVEDRL